MKTVSVEQMKKLERMAVRRYGISTLILMENAGRSVAEWVVRWSKAKQRSAIVFCGPGNNGGDGFVVARHLHLRGFKVAVVFYGKAHRLKPDAKVNYLIVKRLRIALYRASSPQKVLRAIGRFYWKIDALLGTGSNLSVREPILTAIQLLNTASGKVVAVDVPSGLNADTGEARGFAVRAAATVSLAFHKRGVYRRGASYYTGKRVVGHLSLPVGTVKT